MENLEEAAQIAAARWKDRDDAKEQIRVIALEMLKNKNMTEIAKIVGISRTSLYYLLYGRHGKANATIHTNVRNLPTHDESVHL